MCGCVRARVCVCVRACVRACVCARARARACAGCEHVKLRRKERTNDGKKAN